MKLETIIGLEFHVQLKTKSKMFCACANESDVAEPNKNVCPICLGHPGTLPAVNKEAIRMAMKAALAVNCKINLFTKFDRKNYFYPDLPKGYQISQFEQPLAEKGFVIINNKAADGLTGRLDVEEQLKDIGIIRLHMEEDTGKSVHAGDSTLIDFNRGGAPLIEIVSAPHLSTPQEAKTFAQEIQLIMRSLDVSDADMEKGQLRCDANISLRPAGDHEFYSKTEIKNINSFRALERALAFEVERQTLLWEKGTPPNTLETRGWDDAKQETVSQRVKEESQDYRYFPEPDLPPLTFTDEQIDEIKRELPELPQAKRKRFMEMYEFSGEDTKILTASKELANYTEQVISELKAWLDTLENVEGSEEEIWQKHKPKLIKLVSGWLVNKFLPLMNDKKIPFTENKVTPENFAEFVTMIHGNKINSAAAQTILSVMIDTGADPSQVMEEKNLKQMDAGADLDKVVEKIIAANPEQAAQFRAGKEPLIKFFLGLVMRETKGAANPQTTEELLRKKLLEK